MINHPKHDYIELSLVYFSAVILLLILTVVSSPIRDGIISPDGDKASEPIALFNEEAFEGVSIRGEAYVVYDIVDKKIIASKKHEAVLPLASLTKIMTAVSALTHHNSATSIKISSGSIDGGYDLGLEEGQVWKLDELLKYTLVFSSNDGAQAIADTLGGSTFFINEMNKDAQAFGLNLKFTDPAGLDVGGRLGGEGTALDVAKLFALARKNFPDILDATTKNRATLDSSTGRIIGIPNTNQSISGIIGAEGSKTGYTDNAGGNLAIIVDPLIGHPVVIVVLGSTILGRFADVEILYRALLESSILTSK